MSRIFRMPRKLAFTKRHCVSLVLNILCSDTKLTFVLMLSPWCDFHVIGCALSVYHLKSHISILDSCVVTLSLLCYRAPDEFKIISNQHITNTKIPWTQASTNLLGEFTYLWTISPWITEVFAPTVLRNLFVSVERRRLRFHFCWFFYLSVFSVYHKKKQFFMKFFKIVQTWYCKQFAICF